MISCPGTSKPERPRLLAYAESDDQNATAKTAACDTSCLRAFQTRWNATDAEIGYSVAKEAEERAGEHEQELAEALWVTPARSLAGIACKLDALLREGEWCETCPEFPWPQIRSALTDLMRLARLENFSFHT